HLLRRFHQSRLEGGRAASRRARRGRPAREDGSAVAQLTTSVDFSREGAPMNTAIREPAVAGQFYPASPQRLRAEIETFTAAFGKPQEPAQPRLRALGCVVPHAGYIYSGAIAGAVYQRLQLPARYVILCPNHTGYGEPLAIMSRGAWRTPLGDV